MDCSINGLKEALEMRVSVEGRKVRKELSSGASDTWS